ncbi:glycosyltransferase family 2 protein [Flavobacterium sp. TSSA_36]|uniref:glycosyltransferase family 2 protein n=1 Tax=Flavobacterium sp. TSSA_36 TaxID=3447669 RepID=UPI003F2E3F82
MITIYHNTKTVTRILSDKQDIIGFETQKSIAAVLMQMATQFSDEVLVWCQDVYSDVVDWEAFPELLHHRKMMVSFTPSSTVYLGRAIGYVEDSPFITINKEVRYPTWLMSSDIGGMHASILLQFKEKIKMDSDFDYFLHSIAKIGMPLGLCCYSEPRLLKTSAVLTVPKVSTSGPFRFVKQHYKTRWTVLLLLNIMLYEKRFPLFAFMKALFYSNRTSLGIDLDAIVVQSTRKVVEEASIDVIIPTLGRKKYLYAVLKDLALQTHLPKNVIIVEQNPELGSVSELDYLNDASWPFLIKHTFTHQTGACNARNLALAQVESEWVFLNDDDNRFEADLIEKTFENIKKYGEKCVTNSYLQPNEKLSDTFIIQSSIFGSGNSFVKSELLRQVSFDNALEFGYGEDTDFGLQLRNLGIDVIYFPKPLITHLKAPMGGFRTQPKLQWQDAPIPPKPSPTIMYVKQQHDNQEQILGYKTILFFKYYRLQNIKNPFRYFVTFQKQWEVSLFWAKRLKEHNQK